MTAYVMARALHPLLSTAIAVLKKQAQQVSPTLQCVFLEIERISEHGMPSDPCQRSDCNRTLLMEEMELPGPRQGSPTPSQPAKQANACKSTFPNLKGHPRPVGLGQANKPRPRYTLLHQDIHGSHSFPHPLQRN